MIRLPYVVVTDSWEPVAELVPTALARQTAADEVEARRGGRGPRVGALALVAQLAALVGYATTPRHRVI